MISCKQKINLSSLILSRGLLVLHQFFSTNEEFHKFREAEENKEVDKYFQQRSDLSKDDRSNAVLFVEILERSSSVDIELSKEIMLSSGYDWDAWEKIKTKGVIAEYDFFKKLHGKQKIVNGQKILQLFARSISLLSKSSDTILALDKELSLLRRFEELPPAVASDDEIRVLLRKDNSLSLGEALLKRIILQDSGQLFDIAPDLKMHLLQYLYKDIAEDLILDSSLSEYDVKRLRTDQKSFVEYVGQQFDEPQYPAFMALAIEKMPSGYYETPAYLVLLSLLGLQYKKSIIRINDLDHLALVSIYEYIVSKWDAVLADPGSVQDAVDDVVGMRIIVHRELADSYQYLWEWDAAILNNKEIARIAQENDRQSDLESVIVKIIDCLESSFQYKSALKHCISALAGRRSVWKLAKPFVLSDSVKLVLDSKLLPLAQLAEMDLEEVEAIINQYDLTISKELFGVYQGIEHDNFNSEQLEGMQKSLSEIQGKEVQDNFFDKKNSSDEKAMKVLFTMDFFDSTVSSYETQLMLVEEFESELSPGIKLLYDLHRCKLNYLKGDKVAALELGSLLPQMESFPDVLGASKRGHWHSEYIRGMHLCINDPKVIFSKIKPAVVMAIELHMMNFIRNYQEPLAWGILQSEWDNVCKALLINVEACKLSEHKQMLLNLLWDVLIYGKKMFHKYFGRENLTIPDEGVYEENQSTLNNRLWQYFSTKNPDFLKETKLLIRKMNALAYPHYRPKDSFGEFMNNKPHDLSILYHLFTKQNGRRRLLVMKFNPGYKTNNDLAFTYEINDQFELVEQCLSEFQASKSIQWDSEGLLTLLSSPETLGKVAMPLTTLFDDPSVENKALRSFLGSLGGGLKNEENLQLKLYCDQFIHRFPFDMVKDNDGIPYGASLQMASVLNEGNTNATVDLHRGIGIFADVPALPGFPNLTYTSEEANSIMDLFKEDNYSTSCLLGAKANRALITDVIFEKRPAMLHFAVHGVADVSLPPATSALILAPDESGESSALLGYHEVVSWNLSFVDLVVLSACNSSVGRTAKNSPIQGLAYAFLNAGVSCVLASRVEVSDEKTLIFMKRFYQELMSCGNVLKAMKATRYYFYRNKGLAAKDIATWNIWM